MDALIEANLAIHVGAGFLGLLAWWIPLLSRKGGRSHVRFGKAFVVTAFVVGGTALAAAVLRIGRGVATGTVGDNPVALSFLVFLAYIGLFVIDIAWYAVRVIRTRRDHAALSSPSLRVLGAAMAMGSVVVAVWAVAWWTPVSVILLLLSPIGAKQAWDQRTYARATPSSPDAWFYEHMNAMLGAGVAFHTAFLVFGSQRFLDLSQLGAYNWVPWVLPAAIGTLGGALMKRRYLRLGGPMAAAGAPQPT